MLKGIRIAGLIALGGGVGWFIGYFGRDLAKIDLKTEIGLGDVIGFVVTLLVAFLIQNYIQKRFGNERAEKDHLIDLIKDALASLVATRTRFNESYDRKRLTADDQKAIKSNLRSLSNALAFLKETLSDCGESNEVTACSTIQSLYLNYKTAITGGSFPSKPYGGDTFNEAEKIADEIRRELSKMRIRMNRK